MTHRNHQALLSAGVTIPPPSLKSPQSPRHPETASSRRDPAAHHSVRTPLTVPVLQYGIGSTTLSEQQTFDVALNQIRVGLVSVPGMPSFPIGGKQRLVPSTSMPGSFRKRT